MAAGDANEQLNAVYDEKYEDKLMCPITNEPFGRPVLFYPETGLEKERAAKWNSAGKSKAKKKKRKVVDEGDLTIKSRTTTSYINLPKIQKMANEVVGDANESKEIEAYRKLKLIGDTTKEVDNSALGQMFKCARSYKQ